MSYLVQMMSENFEDMNPFERRVTAYLEMHPIILVAALNVHQKSRNAFNQARLFDRRCITEALHRSSIDCSEISISTGICWDNPFSLDENLGKIVHIGRL